MWSLVSSEVLTSLLQVLFLLCVRPVAMCRVPRLSAASCSSVDAPFPVVPTFSPGLATSDLSIRVLVAPLASFCPRAERYFFLRALRVFWPRSGRYALERGVCSCSILSFETCESGGGVSNNRCSHPGGHALVFSRCLQAVGGVEAGHVDMHMAGKLNRIFSSQSIVVSLCAHLRLCFFHRFVEFFC